MIYLPFEVTIRSFSTVLMYSALMLSTSCDSSGSKTNSIQPEETRPLLAGDTVDLMDGEMRDIVQDAKKNLWFVTNGNGVFKYDGKTIVQYTEEHGLPSNYVWMAKEARDGSMWFRTNLRPADVNAISRFDGSGFETISADTTTVPYNFQRGELLFDYYWVDSKLYKIQLPHSSPIKNEENKRHHYDIYATCLDKHGNAWFGTCTAGICKYDGTSFSWFDNKELGAAVRIIFEDSKGTIWAGNNGEGLFRFDGTKFILFSREQNVHNPDFEKYPIGKPGLMSRVWSMTEDNQGNLWVGTIDNGVWKYDGHALTNFTSKDGLGIESIWSVYCDKTGKLWVGTDGDSVYTFNGSSFERFGGPRQK